MNQMEQQSVFLKKLKALDDLLKKANQSSPQAIELSEKIQKTIAKTTQDLSTVIEETNTEHPILSKSMEQGDREMNLTLDLEERSIELTSTNEETGTDIRAQFGAMGIDLSATKTIELLKFETPDIGALVKFNCSGSLEAELSIGGKVRSDKAALEASATLTGVVNLELFIDILELLEFGGKVTLSSNSKIDASLYIEREMGLFKLEPTTHELNAEFFLFLRPGDLVAELIEMIHDILGMEGKEDYEFDKRENAWEIPIADVNLLKFETPGIELPFKPPAKLAGNLLDLPALMKREIDNLDGFVGVVIDIVKWVDEAIEWLGGIADDIGTFFSDLGDDLAKASEEVFASIYPQMGAEMKRLRVEEAQKELATKQVAIILDAVIERIKEQPEHLKALYQRKTTAEKSKYVFWVIWPELVQDQFIIDTFRAVAEKDYKTVHKNSRIAQAEFSIENSAFNGTLVDQKFVIGEPINIALDLRKDEGWVQESINKALEDTEFDLKLNARLQLFILCGNEVVAQTSMGIEEVISSDILMSNAYSFDLLIPKDKNYPDSTHADWSIKATIDFVGKIMDIEERYPIQVTYETVKDHTEVQVQSVLYPKITGLTIKGKKQGNYFIQGTDLNVITKVAIEHLPLGVESLDGRVDVTLFCNKKPVGTARGSRFSLVDHDNPSNIVRISGEIPTNFPETSMGGDWLVRIRLKMKGMESQVKYRRITVVNTSRDYSIGDGGKSWVQEDE